MKFLLSTLFTLSILSCIQLKAQTTFSVLEVAQVPNDRTVETIDENIKFSLGMMYPEIKEYEVIYNDVLKQYRAIFEIQQNKYIVYFNEEGNWIESYVQIDEKQIPEAIIEGIQKSKFKGWQYENPELFQQKDFILYKIYVEKDMFAYSLEMSKEGVILQDIIEE